MRGTVRGEVCVLVVFFVFFASATCQGRPSLRAGCIKHQQMMGFGGLMELPRIVHGAIVLPDVSEREDSENATV